MASKKKEAQKQPDFRPSSGKVPTTVNIDRDVYARLLRFQKSKGMLNIAEAIRLAIVSFLDKNGIE